LTVDRDGELAAIVAELARDPETPSFQRFDRRGFPVLVHSARPDISIDAALERLDRALGLVEHYTPERFAWLRRDLAAILVRRFPCRGAYLPALRVCLIELTFLVHPDITAAQVAASLVHEGEHARIEVETRAGALLTPAHAERRCREAEIELGLAVPGGEAVVERARQALGLADDEVAPAIDWQLAAERVAEVDRRAGGGGKPIGNG
jgi:hypothetical protein